MRMKSSTTNLELEILLLFVPWMFSHTTLTTTKYIWPDDNFAQEKRNWKKKEIENHIPAYLIISLLLSIGNDFSIQSKLADPLALKFRAIRFMH